MAIDTPTTAQLYATALTDLETNIGQTAPTDERSFLNVLSRVLAGQGTGLYKAIVDEARQSSPLTATGYRLDEHAAKEGLARKGAESAAYTIRIDAEEGAVINITSVFVGEANNVRYSVNEVAIGSGGFADVNVTAIEPGAIGNLSIGGIMSIESPLPGVAQQAVITVGLSSGADEESDDDLRARTTSAYRTVSGGGVPADYRRWGEEVEGVRRVYPYASTIEPYRTLYVEATSDVDPDGIAPPELLNSVRESVSFAPDGSGRRPLGIGDTTLDVVSISRTNIYITIGNISIDPTRLDAVKTELEAAYNAYFDSVRPYIIGVDSAVDKDDIVSNPSIGNIANDVVGATGGTVELATFGLTVDTTIALYILGQGELLKLAGVAYV